MKKKLTHFFGVLACVTFCMSANAQTNQPFNSLPGIPVNELQSSLENKCWMFNGFAINANNWLPGIEGDGAMVSKTVSNSNLPINISSPVLDVPGKITVSFKYKMKSQVDAGNTWFLRISLIDGSNMLHKNLETIYIASTNSTGVYTFSKTFNNVGSGMYKLSISYQGSGAGTPIAIDDLNISTNLFYTNGCNSAPIATNDIITGTANRTATSYICSNDADPDGEQIYPYLVQNSNDGQVTIQEDGTVNFTPNPGFSGNSTTFTYRICDEGISPLCSNDATVQINFPNEAMLPVSLVDFSGTYIEQGDVKLSWVTNFESNSERFDIERSFDGSRWEKIGGKPAQGNSPIRVGYNYIDQVGKKRANNKDIYYRLKQVDLDGKVAVSRILIVRVYNTRSVKAVSVTPNPAKNDIAVQLELQSASMVTMKILNSNGMEVQRKSVKAAAGTHSFLIDGSSKLQAGMYVLEVIINSKERMIVKLIKE